MPSASVYYDRKERFAGESKYPFTKMLNFALDGITSFSVKPLRLITTSGLIFMLVSFLAIIYALVKVVSEKGGLLRLVNPFKGKFRIAGKKKKITEKNGVLELKTRAGEEITLERIGL